MNAKRIYFIMIGVVVLLGLANIGAVFAGNQILKSRSQKLAVLKLDNSVLDEQQNSLTQAKKDIETYSDLEKIAKAVVPQDKDQAAAVREIVKIAADNGIKLASISFAASTLGQPTPRPAATTDGTTPTTPKPTTTITQVQPVDGIPGVYTLQINIQQDTTSPIVYSKFISFLSALEQNRRTSQVSSVTVTPNTQDRTKLTFSLAVNAYIKP